MEEFIPKCLGDYNDARPVENVDKEAVNHQILPDVPTAVEAQEDLDNAQTEVVAGELEFKAQETNPELFAIEESSTVASEERKATNRVSIETVVAADVEESQDIAILEEDANTTPKGEPVKEL